MMAILTYHAFMELAVFTRARALRRTEYPGRIHVVEVRLGLGFRTWANARPLALRCDSFCFILT